MRCSAIWLSGVLGILSLGCLANTETIKDYDYDPDLVDDVYSRREPQPQPQPQPQYGMRPESNPAHAYPTVNNQVIYRPHPQRPPPPPQDPNVIVVPGLGLVRGKIAYKNVKNRPINAFLGLRYGVVGRGLKRFQEAAAPKDHLHSNAIIDATHEPANCPQFPDIRKITENEARGEDVDNCLTLNIYAPSKSGLHPIVVYVHGEMLFDGSAEEAQPDYFLEHDVVLISINYRLAPFGFLTTLTDELPGNVALADIHLALKWIKQYIRPFGGNPDQVTLMGQAGGATLVHALSLSGMAQDLFQKLILQSGTALNPYFLDENPINTARIFARYANCNLHPQTTVQDINRCFEHLNTTELLNVFKRHWEENEPNGLTFTGGFKLVVGDRLGYLTQHPAALVANNNVPLLGGVAKDAGAFIMSRFYDQLTQIRSRNITQFINVVLKHTAQPTHYAVWRNLALRHIFTPEDELNPTLQNLAQGLLELVNLILYRGPLIDSIRYTLKRHPTYLYCFDYRGEYHRFGHLENPLPFQPDAILSDDNIYLFPYPEEVSKLNREDNTMANAVTSMWVNFIQHGVPTFVPGIWTNATTEFGPFLRFTNSKPKSLELDYHFGDGISIPNLYPLYFTTTTTSKTTTRTTSTTATPLINYPYYPNYVNYQRNPNYPNYPRGYNYPNNRENSERLRDPYQPMPSHRRYQPNQQPQDQSQQPPGQ